jgi:sulfoxide reductase catalytic subunit YedY
MLILKPAEIPSSEITTPGDYKNRRQFLSAAASAAAGALLLDGLSEQALAEMKLQTIKSPITTNGEELTSRENVTTYNNYYEFGTDKSDPAKYAGTLHTRPWTVRVEGLVKKPKTFDIDALLKLRTLEDRVYRHRCVEGWSMVIPWVGYSLAEFIRQCDPLPSAKYVQFLTLYDPRQMPQARYANINWPYSEGLRMDEAMNPLTLLTFGLYGEVLPNQNGAPVRVVVPWKYGFKSAKSIVAIRFVDRQPPTTWNVLNSAEYGFYSNVNPNHDHPRWSQKNERRIGQPFYKQRRTTLMFNGYGDAVASMYNGMDLNRYY